MNEPIVDDDAIRRLRALGGDEFVEEALVTFMGSARKQVGLAEQALASTDADGVARAAHTIRGSAGNIGAMRLHRCATWTESAARNASADTLRVVVEELRAALDEFEAAIKERALF